jgi:LysM repeat protein
VTERALPLADGAPACPFVAFEDERDERASVPDHRHRCYAEPTPAPRALAHQEAYCLSSAFPVCPTFQDWARREAARASGSSPDSPAAAAGAASAAVAAAAVRDAEDDRDVAAVGEAEASGGMPGSDAPPDDRAQRNPPRDWSAPPPWLASAEVASAAAVAGGAEPPPFLGKRASEPGQGLAGSAADQLAGGPPPSQRPTPSDAYAPAGAPEAVALGAADAAEDPGEQAVARPNRRPRAYDQHLGGPNGPDWEQPRRYEAYPTIRTRVGVPRVPRVPPALLAAAALVIAALALFFLVPGMLNIGGSSSGSVSPTPTPSAAASAAPTVPPAPTPQLYTIKKGDTLSKIAKANGVSIEELLAANKDIKNPNKVAEGQQIIIPLPSQEAPDQVEASAGPSGGASASP